MLHRIPWAIALGVAVIVPVQAADSKSDTTNPKPPPTTGKWKLVGQLTGQVKNTDGTTLKLTIQVPDLQANQNSANKQTQNLQRQLSQASRNRNPAAQMAQMQQIMMSAQMQQMKNLKYKKQDVDLKLAQEVEVRTKELPVEFDEKGTRKKYTAEELKTLKGPGNKWGFPTDSGMIKPGAILHVYVYRKKPESAHPTPTGSLLKKDPKTKDEADDKATVMEDEDGTDPIVRLVYLLQEGNDPAPAGKGKKNQ